jgi:hypothetical protein
MVGRPCKPDPDVNWLWRTLLPNTPLPGCNINDERCDDRSDEKPGRAANPREQAGPSWIRKFWPAKSDPNS